MESFKVVFRHFPLSNSKSWIAILTQTHRNIFSLCIASFHKGSPTFPKTYCSDTFISLFRKSRRLSCALGAPSESLYWRGFPGEPPWLLGRRVSSYASSKTTFATFGRWVGGVWRCICYDVTRYGIGSVYIVIYVYQHLIFITCIVVGNFWVFLFVHIQYITFVLNNYNCRWMSSWHREMYYKVIHKDWFKMYS